MNVQWDPKIGLAAVSAIGGTILILVGLGVTWGNTTRKIDAAALLAAEAKAAAKEVSDQSARRDNRVNEQAQRLSKIETAVEFIVPSLQRIETKIDKMPP